MNLIFPPHFVQKDGTPVCSLISLEVFHGLISLSGHSDTLPPVRFISCRDLLVWVVIACRLSLTLPSEPRLELNVIKAINYFTLTRESVLWLNLTVSQPNNLIKPIWINSHWSKTREHNFFHQFTGRDNETKINKDTIDTSNHWFKANTNFLALNMSVWSSENTIRALQWQRAEMEERGKES